MTLVEAAALLGADSPITASTLRNAIARGELAAIRLSSKIFVTKAALLDALTPRLKRRVDPPRLPPTDEIRAAASLASAMAQATKLQELGKEQRTQEKLARAAEIEQIREYRKNFRNQK